MIATNTTPFIVHCSACRHEWVACHLPMLMEDFARFATEAARTCTNCGDISGLLCGSPAEVAASG